jgi:menaquinol-cytochrome c reductase cytochrome b/c subunit
MAEEVELDQEVYDKLIAEGKSERIARAKAKAAAVRAKKAAAGEELGPREAKPAAAKADGGAKAEAGAGAGAKAGGGVATAQRGGGTGALTPEERQARVAAALERKGGAKSQPRSASKLAGQDHTHRLLAMVPPTGIQQIRGKQDDKVYTWPHLISAEFVCLMAVTAVLTLFSALVSAPLGELANPNVTPNPSKAPWYFMGLQELLRYFHPMVAGVTLPTIFLVGFVALPYIDKNPSVRPENRKTAYVLFTFYMVFWGVLTIVGSFFRGPGFNWVWPWVDGLWFVL